MLNTVALKIELLIGKFLKTALGLYLSFTIYYVDLFVLFVYVRGHPRKFISELELYRTCVTGEQLKQRQIIILMKVDIYYT